MRPSGSTQRTALRGVLTAVGALMVMTTASVLGAMPASAHTELVSSTPADGSTSDVGPSRIVLTFDEAPGSVTSVLAESTDGKPVALGSPTVSGRKVIVAWPATQLAGVYRVVYSLVSDDGDPVTGTVVFGYRSVRSPTPGSITDGASADPSASSASPSGPDGSTPPSATPSPSPSSSEPAAAPVSSVTSGPSGWLAVAVVVVAVVAALLALLLRRRSQGSQPDA